MKVIRVLCKGKNLDNLVKTIVFIRHGIGAVHELGQISKD